MAEPQKSPIEMKPRKKPAPQQDQRKPQGSACYSSFAQEERVDASEEQGVSLPYAGQGSELGREHSNASVESV